ncbi:MAG TPA: hypothetical protein VMM27_13500 [Casimicrobiaceae bacterium]|nr:hypothetical protein [Casimicrobiaceae bacterium]
MTAQATYPHYVTPRHSLLPGRIFRMLALLVAIVSAVGVMAGESWLLENAPGTAVACEIGQASDFTRALDSGIAAMAAVSDVRAR